MTLVAASFGARARSGGRALGRPFDGANLDLLTGPRVATTLLSNSYTGTALSLGTGAPNNTGNLGMTAQATAFGYSGSNPCAIELYQDAQLIDCSSVLPVASEDSGPVFIVHSSVATNANAQVAFNNSQPAISVSGLVQNTDVSDTAQDGIWPSSDSVHDGIYAMGGSVPFYAGWDVDPSVIPWQSGYTPGATNGLPLTKAQILSAINYYNQNGSGQNGGTNGVTIPWGGFILCPSRTSTICPIYKCVGSVDGTTNPPLIGNENTDTWPDAGGSGQWRKQTTGSNQPFASGNALLAGIGGAYHCDTFQCVGDPSRVVIRNFRVGQFPNTVLLLQNDASAKSLPPMNWTIEHGVCFGAGSYDIPLSTLTGSSSYTIPQGSNMHNPTGPFMRNSDGTWQVDPTSGMSVPWYVTLRDVVHMNSTSQFAAARNPATSVTFDKAYDPAGAPVLPNESARDLLVASQYGWDVTDRRIAMMRNGTYDWVNTGQPAPISSVLEARFQALVAAVPATSQKAQMLSPAPGVVGAQMMPVIEPSCRNQQGVSLTPSTSVSIPYPVSTAVTDAQGYYTGG